jgi:hypothetical protein
MTRREFVTLLGRAAAWPLIVALPAEAAQKLPRLCFVTFDPGTLQTNRFGVFFSELSDLGYVGARRSRSTISQPMVMASGSRDLPRSACAAAPMSLPSLSLRRPRRLVPAQSPSLCSG